MSDRKVSKLVGIPRSTIYHWEKEDNLPVILNIIKEMPNKKLKEGYKWLPKLMMPRGKPKMFIEAPEKIRSYADIIHTLRQFNSKNFIDLEKNFAYLLGIMISDGDKQSVSNYSKVCRLRLSKKYFWSSKVGKAFCESLNSLGFRAWRGKDSKPFESHPNGFYNWTSEASPFFTWLTKACLGLKDGELTSYHKVKMNWITESPMYFRKCFLQGLFDGDGSASLGGWYISNSCHPNQDLIKEILKTFRIKCHINSDGVVISENRSILTASKIPLFKNATGRLTKMLDLCEMINNSARIREIDDKIADRIRILANNGLKSNSISERIFYEYKKGIRPSSISRFIKA